MIQFDPGIREILDDGSMLVQDFAEGGLIDVSSSDQSEVESPGSDSERSHAGDEESRQYECAKERKEGKRSLPVVDSSGTETTLNDLESFTPSEDQVLLGDSNVVVDDLIVTFGSIVVTELAAE